MPPFRQSFPFAPPEQPQQHSQRAASRSTEGLLQLTKMLAHHSVSRGGFPQRAEEAGWEEAAAVVGVVMALAVETTKVTVAAKVLPAMVK